MAMTSPLLRPDSGSTGAEIAVPSLSGTLSSAQQTIVIGGADTPNGTLSGNTLKFVIVRMQLVNALNALLTCSVKLNGTAMTGLRVKWDGAAVSSDTVPFRMFGGVNARTDTNIEMRFTFRSGTDRTGVVEQIEMADNFTNNEAGYSYLWLPGGDRTTDITTITVDCGSAGGIKAGSTWQVWYKPDPA